MSINTMLAFPWVFILEHIFVCTANEVWAGIWEQIVAAVSAAEAKWIEAGRGEAKKAEVVEAVMAWLQSKAQLNWLQGMLARLFVSKAVDAIVVELNDKAGKDWGSKVVELERALAEKLPVIA